MGIHFDNLAAAIRHLQKMGWSNFVNAPSGADYWLSKDGTCRATIQILRAGGTVCVHAYEI